MWAAEAEDAEHRLCQKGGDACIASSGNEAEQSWPAKQARQRKVKWTALAKRAQQNSGWRAKNARRCDLFERKARAPVRVVRANAIAREVKRPIARATADQQASQAVTQHCAR